MTRVPSASVTVSCSEASVAYAASGVLPAPSMGAAEMQRALSRVKARGAGQPLTSGRARVAALVAAAAVLVFAIVTLRRPDGAGNTPLAAYATEASEQDTVTLADGTRVIMAPSTTLEVLGTEIELAGRAYFDIADDRGPYVVRARGAVVRDIGTRFDVRAYRNEPMRVVVLEGAVELSLAATTVSLDSGDVGVIDESGHVSVARDAAGPVDTGWLRGHLVFRDASLAEVAADLRRWYGVELRIADSALRGRRFTGTFEAEPAARVLDIIALALGGRVERRGDTAFVIQSEPR